MTYFDRAAWGAKNPDSPGGLVVHPNTRTHFVTHHTTGSNLGDPDPQQWVRNIQNQHMAVNGWEDIGYNFLVDRNGDYYEGRGWDRSGACQYGLNTGGWCVAYLGGGATGDADYDPLPPTAAALRTIRALADEADFRAGKSLIRLGHTEVPNNSTECPGDILLDWVHAGMPVDIPHPVIPADHLVLAMLMDGKVLGADGERTDNGTHVNQWALHMHPSQLWALDTNGVLWHVGSEKVLSVDLNPKAGSHILIWDRVEGDDQQLWRFDYDANRGGYLLHHLATGLVLGIAGDSPEGATDALLVEPENGDRLIGIWVQ